MTKREQIFKAWLGTTNREYTSYKALENAKENIDDIESMDKAMDVLAQVFSFHQFEAGWLAALKSEGSA